MRILLLGGTAEASELARRLAADPSITATLSLAGRTSHPRPQPLATRIGGFGGAGGLAHWLEAEGVEAVIDATHPYAARISANAVAACARLGLPLASVVRAPWRAREGDDWRSVDNAEAAACALGRDSRRVFLGLGRLELAAFAQSPQHDYLARTIDAPGDIALPPRIRFILERGPFVSENEIELLRRERIEILVSKNSGGSATYGKIEAARGLGLPVIMIARPEKKAGVAAEGAAAAYEWLVYLKA